MSTLAPTDTVLIVGAGVAGWTSAVALGKLGIACRVVDRTADPLGSGISISGRAVQALHEIGVLDAVLANASVPSGALVVRDAAGELLNLGDATTDAAPHPPGRPGLQEMPMTLAVYWPLLIKALRSAALAGGAVVDCPLTVTSLRQSGRCVDVTFSDGSVAEYQLVIGADGAHSSVRRLVFPNAADPQRTGQASFRWMAPGPMPEEGPAGLYETAGCRIVSAHVPPGLTYVGVLTAGDGLGRSVDDDAARV